MGLLRKRSIGINFGSDPATFAEVTKMLGRVSSVRLGSLKMAADGMGLHADVSPAPDGDGEATNTAENSFSGGNADDVIVGLPRRCFLVRFLELPDLNDDELSTLLAYELDRHLPFSPEEAWYGFQKLERRQGKAQVMLVAAKRREVEQYLDRVKQLGLQPTGVEVSAIAAVNAFLFHQRDGRREVHSLISLNGKEAGVSVVKNSVLLSSRSVFIRNGSFDAVFAELKRIASVVPEGPGKVFVSGERDGFSIHLKQELGIQANEWSLAGTSTDASAFGLAVGGLAKLPFWVNLLPPERRAKKRAQAASIMFALLCLVGVLGGGLTISSAVQERKMLVGLDHRLAEVRAESASVAKLRREATQLENMIRRLGGLVEKQERPLLILKELAQILPPSVSLNELSIQDDKLKIRGTTSASASDLISVFERSAMFENAAFVSPISKRGKDQQGFQIQASIKTRFPELDQGSKPTARRGRG